MNNSLITHRIEELQTSLQSYGILTEPQIIHYQIDNVYVREMWLRAGTMLVGKTHKKDHICIISKGIVKVVSDELTQLIEAPYTYISKKGVKRAMYAITDLVWSTVHNVNEIDLDKIEEELVQTETYLMEI